MSAGGQVGGLTPASAQRLSCPRRGAGKTRKGGGDVSFIRHVPKFLQAHAHLLGQGEGQDEDAPVTVGGGGGGVDARREDADAEAEEEEVGGWVERGLERGAGERGLGGGGPPPAE